MGIISIFSHLYPLLYATIGYRTGFFVFIPNLFSFVGYFPPTFFLIPASDLSLWVSCAHFPFHTHILACLVGIVRSYPISYPYLISRLGYRTYLSSTIPSSNQTPRVSYLLIHCHTQKSSIIKQ